MIESIASLSMSMSAARLQQELSLQMTSMVMSDQEALVENLMDMADAVSVSSDGMPHVIDMLV